MQPFKYMSEVASTKTFKSPNLKTLSIMPAWFSNDIEYWNPEQPPPTTPTRRPAGRGSCVAIISCTLAIACGDSVRGADTGLRVVTGSATLDIVFISVNYLLLNSLRPGRHRVKPESHNYSRC